MIEATPAYASVLAAIHAAAFPPGERWGPDAIALQLAMPGAFGFIVPDGGFILARVAADEAEILTLAVDPAIQRRGLGRRLMDRAMAEAANRQARTFYLEVSAQNLPAQSLYTVFGFTEIARRPRYYAGAVDALVMRAIIPCGATGE